MDRQHRKWGSNERVLLFVKEITSKQHQNPTRKDYYWSYAKNKNDILCGQNAFLCLSLSRITPDYLGPKYQLHIMYSLRIARLKVVSMYTN